MSRLRRMLGQASNTFRRRTLDLASDEEIRVHIDSEMEENLRLGMSSKEARRNAVVDLGSVERHREKLCWSRWVGKAEDSWRNLRFAVRSLLRTPGISVVIVVVLALGIGVCTAIYSVAQATVFDSIPFPASHELFSVELISQGGGALPSLEEFRAWQVETSESAELAAYSLGPRVVGGSLGTVEAVSLQVTEQFFGILRAEPLLGRPLLPAGGSPTDDSVAVISARMWRDLFRSEPSVIGSTLRLSGMPHTIVGILRDGQGFLHPWMFGFRLF